MPAMDKLLQVHSTLCVLLGTMPSSWSVTQDADHKPTAAHWVVDTPAIKYANPNRQAETSYEGSKIYLKSWVMLDYASGEVTIEIDGAELIDLMRLYAVLGYCAAHGVPHKVKLL